MIPGSPTRRGARGFTLIEVLLAVTIFAIVLTAINTVFYSALRLRDRTAATLDESVPLNQALAILRRDLQGTMPPGGILAVSFKGGMVSSGFSTTQGSGIGLAQGGTGLAQSGGTGLGQGTGLAMGQAIGLEFYTCTGILENEMPWGDVQRVSYQLRDPADRTHANGKEMIRSVSRNLLATTAEAPVEQYLMGNIENWELACFDGMEWRESWDTTLGDTNLPQAVKVRIQLAGNFGENRRDRQPLEMVIPLVSQSRTNQTESTGGQQ